MGTQTGRHLQLRATALWEVREVKKLFFVAVQRPVAAGSAVGAAETASGLRRGAVGSVCQQMCACAGKPGHWDWAQLGPWSACFFPSPTHWKGLCQMTPPQRTAGSRLRRHRHGGFPLCQSVSLNTKTFDTRPGSSRTYLVYSIFRPSSFSWCPEANTTNSSMI